MMDDYPLHTLWTKAVGAPNYNKAEWRALEAKLCNALSALEAWAEWAVNRDVPFELISRTRHALAEQKKKYGES